MRLILKRSTMKAQYVCFRRPKLVDYKTCNCKLIVISMFS